MGTDIHSIEWKGLTSALFPLQVHSVPWELAILLAWSPGFYLETQQQQEVGSGWKGQPSPLLWVWNGRDCP